MPYAVSSADVEARWRPLSSDEYSLSETLLDDLKNDLRLRRPALEPMLDAMTLADPEAALMLQRTITRVLAGVVKRAMRNPDTLRSTNIGADGGIAVGYDNAASALAATGAALTRADMADIDLATAAVGGEVATASGSVKLQAYPERYAAPDMNALPLP